jgi:RimJ/RimL family protein N-acetyltransferase
VIILATERLFLRHMREEDAAFVHELLNEPSFLQYIGDRGVRTLDDARAYIRNGPLDSYARHGFGLYVVEAQDAGEPMGICGLLRRDTLDAPDVGFAFLPRYWAKGYAIEAARAVVDHAFRTHGLDRVLAITSPDNDRSIALLGRLGFRFQGLEPFGAEAAPVRLFALDRPAD